MLPFLVGGAVALGISLAVRLGFDYLTEADVRQRQDKIRRAKQEFRQAKADLDVLHRAVGHERMKREKFRRQALVSYRNRELKLVEGYLEILEAANDAAHKKLDTIERQVDQLPTSGRHPNTAPSIAKFQRIGEEVRGAVREGRRIAARLTVREGNIERELALLEDETTLGRLGAKAKLESLISEMERDARQLFAGRGARGTEVPVNHVAFVLDVRCHGCRAWISPAMVYCPLCGEQHKNDVPVRYFKKDVVGAPCCHACNAPTLEGLKHCYNCREVLDPFHLRAALTS